jgi:hypothetical protein
MNGMAFPMLNKDLKTIVRGKKARRGELKLYRKKILLLIVRLAIYRGDDDKNLEKTLIHSYLKSELSLS